MSPTQEAAMRQALEALEDKRDKVTSLMQVEDAITALRSALAEQQEPVAWLTPGQDLHLNNGEGFRFSDWTPLYTASPQRKPLSGIEVERLLEQVIGSLPVARKLVRAVEKAHGIS